MVVKELLERYVERGRKLSRLEEEQYEDFKRIASLFIGDKKAKKMYRNGDTQPYTVEEEDGVHYRIPVEELAMCREIDYYSLDIGPDRIARVEETLKGLTTEEECNQP